MKFDTIIQNPPYSGSFHLDFLEKSINLLKKNKGRMIIIEPSTWLINVRKNGKVKRYNLIKECLSNHIESVVIENYNKDFNTTLFVPFSITTIDMSKKFDTIDCYICGDHKTIKSIYDCNLIGEYNLIWSILNKVVKYKDMMCDHITQEDKGNGYWYAKYAEIMPVNLCGGGGRLLSDHSYRTCLGKDYCASYSASGYHSDTTATIQDSLTKRRNMRGVVIEDSVAENVYGTKLELENWKHFIFNNKLPLFINIVMTIDQHNNSKEFLPWLVDKQYTDNEINKLFGFTKEEINLIETTIKKFERSSIWFQRYVRGRESNITNDDISKFINKITSYA